MKQPLRIFDSPPRRAPRFATIARACAGAALVLLAVAIVLGVVDVNRDGLVGEVIFPTLGVVTLLGGVSALLAGVAAMVRERDRSVGTILATVAGALLGGLMILELFIEG